MKKFLSKIMFAAVAVLSVAGFTSCNAEDDDYDYNYNTTNTTNTTNNATVKKVSVYTAYVSEDCLNLYDVSITLHSGDKSKTIILNESTGTKQALGPGQAYTFTYDNVDGQYNIDKVEASVTPKANIEDMIKSMDPEKDLYIVTTKAFGDKEFKANGQYDTGNQYKMLTTSTVSAGSLTKLLDNGKTLYNHIAEANTSRLAQK